MTRSKLLTSSLRHHLIVLDKLGFIPFSATGAQLIFQFCLAEPPDDFV